MWTRPGRSYRPVFILIICMLILSVIMFQNSDHSYNFIRRSIGKIEHRSSFVKAFSDMPALISSPKPVLEKCGKGKYLVGPLYVDKQHTTWQTLGEEIQGVKMGGVGMPSDCNATVKMALIIPYRNREEHLKIFLRLIHPILQRQRLIYRIFTIDQVDKSNFNRAKLMNVGFNESLKYNDFNCFVFHDVDLLPENDKIYYGCDISPAHLSVAIDKFNYRLPYSTIFGGIEMFTKVDFEKINGFSNIFWGWGGEDDNLYRRISSNGLALKRPAIELARYQMIKHEESPKFDNRHEVFAKATKLFKEDGINNLKYRVLDRVEHMFHTQIQVDLQESKD